MTTPTTPASSSSPVVAGLTVVAFQQAQAAAARAMIESVGRLLRRYGIPSTPSTRARLVEHLLPTVLAARQSSYDAGIAHMRHAAHAAGVQAPIPVPITEYTPRILDEAIQTAIEKAEAPKKPRIRVIDDQVTRAVEKRPRVRVTVGAAVAKHAQAAGRDAVQRTAENHGEEIGWARVLTGAENCGFCVMLASRGPVYKTDRTAQHRGRNQVDDTYHDHCDCVPTLVYKGRDWEGRERFELAEDLWTAATKGYRQKDALNALRRALARADREGWTHQQLLDVLRAENAPK